MNKRTDKFRPSVIDPTKFTFVSLYYLGSSVVNSSTQPELIAS
jgi:hypothetical protein